MAQESDNGIAYLTALRQAASNATTQPPQHSEAADPDAMPGANNAGERFEGAEKRRAPRYKCEGSAEIREDGKDVRTWATFSDISIHGCYVEAQATYPAGTILHMKLDANGVRFETEAIVRVSYPYLGMGIAFTEMTVENDALLRQLLAKVSHPCTIVGPGIASSLPSTGPLEALPTITDPGALVQELIDFFENRQMLMRDDFVRILRKSQGAEGKQE
jgi:hypothetical protein